MFDHFAITFEYDDGVRGFHMCRHFPNSPSDNSDTIMGSKGVCRVNGWVDLHEITGETNWKCKTPKNDMYQAEHVEFFQSLRSGKPINDGVGMATYDDVNHGPHGGIHGADADLGAGAELQDGNEAGAVFAGRHPAGMRVAASGVDEVCLTFSRPARGAMGLPCGGSSDG